MLIKFDTSTTGPHELTAIIALCASLGGRLPGSVIVNNTIGLPVKEVSQEQLEAAFAAGTATFGPNNGALPPEADDVPPPPVAASAEGNDTPAADTTEATPDGTAIKTVCAEIELDADGIPWDERIHASTKTQTKGGTWTKKRNVDEVEYGRIHAELQEQHSPADEGNDVPPPPSDTSAENAPTADTDVPPPPADAAPAVSEGSGDFADFAELVTAVSKFGLPYVKLAELATTVSDGKVTKFPDLRSTPELWADFFGLAQSSV